MFFKPLPWDYGVRNLFRRPARSALTLLGLSLVVVLVFVVVGFIEGLEQSLAASGDPQVAIVFGLGMGENLEYSSIPARTAELLPASIRGVQSRFGRRYVSPELYLATTIGVPDGPTGMGLARGVTPEVLLVRRQVEIIEGDWPGPGQALVGRLAAAKLGLPPQSLAVGRQIQIEGRRWQISGIMAAGAAVFESEIWCPLADLQQAMQRQDLSLVAVTLRPEASFGQVDLFCKQRLDLQLQAIREPEYFAALADDYAAVRALAWLVVLMVAAAGVFAGLNTMYGAVMGRVRELATLQAMGFARRAILLSLIQEGVLLAAAASLLAALVAFTLIHGAAVRFTMGAFVLRIDAGAVLIGCGTGLALGLLGSIPPAVRALRLPVVEGLKAV